MHPVSVSIYDLAGGQKIRQKWGGDEVGRLLYHKATSRTLCYYVELYDNPEVSSVQGQVLPDLGVQVARFDYLEPKRPHANFDYYVDIVRVVEQGERWVVRDLYLDVIVFEGVRAVILDTDEYLAAITEGHLGAEEATYALNTAHTLLNGLANHGYSLQAWLGAQGVSLTWRR